MRVHGSDVAHDETGIRRRRWAARPEVAAQQVLGAGTSAVSDEHERLGGFSREPGRGDGVGEDPLTERLLLSGAIALHEHAGFSCGFASVAARNDLQRVRGRYERRTGATNEMNWRDG
jgi:hypothetical protein